MRSIIEQKAQLVDEIAEKLKNSMTTVIVNYRGLTVKDVTELRAQLRNADVEFKVYKNSMVRRAAEKVGLTGVEEHLTGPNAIALCATDAVSPAKILNDFAKTHDALEIKAGVLDGRLASVEEIKTLAELPSRDGLLSMLLSVLQAPMRNLALVTKAVADQKEA